MLLSVSPAGTEFRVNATTDDDQRTWISRHQSVATDSVGNFVVTWSSFEPGYQVYAQRYDAAGTPLGTEFQVKSESSARVTDWMSAVAMDPDGDFVIAWSGYNLDDRDFEIYARRYSAAGTPKGEEFQVNTSSADDQRGASIAMDADGDFVIAWSRYHDDAGIYAQRYDAAGDRLGTEFQVNTHSGQHILYPVAAMDADGDFVVTWSSFEADRVRCMPDVTTLQACDKVQSFR
jgi:hypothetical protein